MNIALAGFGQEGRASYDYWNNGDNTLTIAAETETVNDAPEGVALITGADAFSKLTDFDLIIRSPSVNPNKLPYGNKVWSATNEFFEKCPAPIIGVTGTKGKGTTSSLITSILRAAGKTVHLVGNIGTPALTELSNITETDIVVFEISSFQLWDIRRSPHVAVVLGIEPDHLDVHNDYDDYVAAKANIAKYQTSDDLIVYNANNTVSSSIAGVSAATVTAYPNTELVAIVGDSLTIPGRHNVENATAAVAAVQEYVADIHTIRTGLAAFDGLPHRIKFVRSVNGVDYYDDSYSSAPAASIAALKSFEQDRIILLGGYEKHADFTELAQYIATQSNIRVVLFGQTKERIAAALKTAGVESNHCDVLSSANFSEIVSFVATSAKPGDIVLLSPACASFDMFKNFTDRGDQFIALVNDL